MLDGEEVRRSYSICSGPDDGEIAHRREEGRRRRVLELGGRRIEARRRARRDDADRAASACARAGRGAHHVGFAAGSGITPILSIVKGVLAREPDSRFFLFYGNRTTDNIMFLEALEELKDRFIDRLSIFHVISGEEQDIPILHGRLDGDKVRVLLRSLVPAASVDHVFICGPARHERGDRGDLPRSRHRRRAHSRRAFRLRVRRQAAAEEGRCARRAAEGDCRR